MNDLIRLAIDRACIMYSKDGIGGVFHAAGFSEAIRGLAGTTDTVLDGHIVRLLLTGRDDVKPMKDGSYYKRISE